MLISQVLSLWAKHQIHMEGTLFRPCALSLGKHQVHVEETLCITGAPSCFRFERCLAMSLVMLRSVIIPKQRHLFRPLVEHINFELYTSLSATAAADHNSSPTVSHPPMKYQIRWCQGILKTLQSMNRSRWMVSMQRQ